MLNYAVERVFQFVPVLLMMSVIVFFVMQVMPGDAAMLQLAGGAVTSRDQIERLREQMGLDDPIHVQYFRFLSGAVRGDFGRSMRSRRPVIRVIQEHFPATLELAAAGIVVSVVTGVALGTVGAMFKDTWVDSVTMLVAVLGVSMPVFWSGLMLIYVFSFGLNWFPSTGGIVLPAVTLGLVGTGMIARLTRSGILEVMSQDYIRTARAKGVKELLILWRHAMKNAMLPIVTMVGLQFGVMLSGAVVTETVFSRPGMGLMTVNAILWKDFPMAQGAIVIMAVVYAASNLLVDLTYGWLDPRIGYDG